MDSLAIHLQEAKEICYGIVISVYKIYLWQNYKIGAYLYKRAEFVTMYMPLNPDNGV